MGTLNQDRQDACSYRAKTLTGGVAATLLGIACGLLISLIAADRPSSLAWTTCSGGVIGLFFGLAFPNASRKLWLAIANHTFPW